MLYQFTRQKCWAYAFDIAILTAMFAPLPAYGQTGPYQTTVVGNIGPGTPCGTTNHTTTITVTENIIIADLDVGFLASHAWRTDMNAILTSPIGTSVRILDGPYGLNATNYNVRFDDEAVNLVDTGTHTTNDTVTVVPPYQNTVRPENALTAFDGENANGTWTLDVCDTYPSIDNGQFRQANLFFTPVPAILSATKTVDIWDPMAAGLYALPGNDVIYTLSIQNTGDGYTDNNSLFLVDSLPEDTMFYNGDIDDDGPETTVVSFTNSGSGLSFDPNLHLGYSNTTSKPTSFAQCNYAPATGYDTAIKHVCFQPDGQMEFEPATPSFSVQFRARIK